jgi:hypothetical protein
MALVLEDGTGLETSNAYIDETYLDSYAALRAIDLSAYDTAAKEAAIITCTLDFIDVYYSFKGDILEDDQALSLPTDEVGINKDVQSACANGAILHLKGLLLVDESLSSQSGEVKSQQDKIDVLETRTEYIEGTSNNYKRDTPIIDRLLSKYLGFGGTPRLVVT